MSSRPASSDPSFSLDRMPRVFTGQLRRLRRRLALWFAADGLNRVLASLFVVVGVDLLIDWYFRMDRAQRGIMLVLGVGVLCWVAWRYLIKPLTARLSDEALVLEMEKRGAYGEGLITALEFSRTDWSRHPRVAEGLVKETIARGVTAGESLSLRGILRSGRFRLNVLLAAVLLSGLGALVVACQETPLMATWFNRNVLLGQASWPQDFYFSVRHAEGTTLRIPRGDDYTLSAEIEEGYRYLPDEVKVEFRTGAGRRLETMDRSAEGEVFVHQMLSVTEPMSFRLTSKNIRSDWYTIELLRRPEIEEVVLRSTPPEYTGAEGGALPSGQGPYYVLQGSRLSVSGRADKELASAWVEVGEERWPMEVNGQGFQGEIGAADLVSGTYTVDLEDRETVPQLGREQPGGLGLREPLRFKLRLKEDETPKITARLEGISGMVVSRARLPYRASLADDFALTEVALAWQWREDAGEAEPKEGHHTPSGVAAALGTAAMELDEAFDIEALEIPAGSRLSLHLRATDNDIVSGPKTGTSTEMIVRVVSEAELRDDLLRREKDQRQLVADMVDRQDQLLTETQAHMAETRGMSSLESEARSQVVRLTKRQGQLAQGILPVTERLRGMVAEITNNRLEEEDGVLRERLLTRIIGPLEDVSAGELTLAEAYLERVRRAEAAEERQQLFAAAVTNQEAGLTKLRQILVHMVKNESYQQAVNLLYEIQKSQEDLRKRTEEQKAEKVAPLFQDGEEGEGSAGETPEESEQP